MKAFFVFLINGQRIATWANNEEEAIFNLKNRFGNDIKPECVSIELGKICTKDVDEYITTGMSTMDRIIASGFLNMFSRGANK